MLRHASADVGAPVFIAAISLTGYTESEGQTGISDPATKKDNFVFELIWNLLGKNIPTQSFLHS